VTAATVRPTRQAVATNTRFPRKLAADLNGDDRQISADLQHR